jgi:hypothetical protein
MYRSKVNAALASGRPGQFNTKDLVVDDDADDSDIEAMFASQRQQNQSRRKILAQQQEDAKDQLESRLDKIDPHGLISRVRTLGSKQKVVGQSRIDRSENQKRRDMKKAGLKANARFDADASNGRTGGGRWGSSSSSGGGGGSDKSNERSRGGGKRRGKDFVAPGEEFDAQETRNEKGFRPRR